HPGKVERPEVEITARIEPVLGIGRKQSCDGSWNHDGARLACREGARRLLAAGPAHFGIEKGAGGFAGVVDLENLEVSQSLLVFQKSRQVPLHGLDVRVPFSFQRPPESGFLKHQTGPEKKDGNGNHRYDGSPDKPHINRSRGLPWR